MATAKTKTLLPLDDFAKLMQIHPLHFNQLYIENMPPCGVVWLQYNWQGSNCASREEVAQAIKSAEDSLEQFLGFPVAPKWFEDEYISVAKSYTGLVTLSKARYLYGGKRAETLIEAGATITYSDEDSDGYQESAEVTVATSVTDPDEIAISYPDENLLEWEIRPVTVSIASGIATIKFKRHQVVAKNKLEALVPSSIIATEYVSNFLEEVDVYRVYNNPEIQAYFHGSATCCVGCSRCTYDISTGCIRGENPIPGIVYLTPANFVDDAWELITCPTVSNYFLARTNFKAGWPLENGRMADIWAMAVARLALSRLSRPLCPCPDVQERMKWWVQDLSHTHRDIGSYKVPEYLKSCPWGYTRAALFAYEVAVGHQQPQGKR